MTDDLLLAAIAAVRAAGDEVEAGAPQATVLRVRRSLEARARRPRIWAAIAAALGISSIGGVAFAIATGRLVVGAKAEPQGARAAGAAVDVAPQQTDARPPLRAAAAPIVAPAPIEVPVPAPAPAVAERTERRPGSVRPARGRGPEIEAAYRRAHELHFRGADPAAALAAWDDYLRADPSGRFAAEARFNRAIDLIRLGRYDLARAALAPFTRGDEGAYHHDDARRLLDRLDAIGRPDSTIVDVPGTPR